jgi:hypothetical protein
MARPQRLHRRFDLCCRIRLAFSSDGIESQLDAITRNVSIGGLLLDSPRSIPLECSVSFTMIAEGGNVSHPLEFTGAGQVLRVNPDFSGDRFDIALKCLREIEWHRVPVAAPIAKAFR